MDLTYDAVIAQEKNGRPFAIAALRPIQLSKRDVLSALYEGRAKFTTAEWKQFLLRSIGLEPSGMTARNADVMLLRMIPFVEANYNLVELGPRGTGKSHLFQQISPYSHLVSGGKATVARMFVNNANGQRGLVCLYDVVCFDEVSGVSFDQKDGVNIMKEGNPQIHPEFASVFATNFARKTVVLTADLIATYKSGIGESNPSHSLGKAGHSRYTNPASR